MLSVKQQKTEKVSNCFGGMFLGVAGGGEGMQLCGELGPNFKSENEACAHHTKSKWRMKVHRARTAPFFTYIKDKSRVYKVLQLCFYFCFTVLLDLNVHAADGWSVLI